MSEEFEEMQKAGWRVAYIATEQYAPDNEVVTFHRPRQKANAIVDFNAVQKAYQLVILENSKEPMCRTCRAAVEEIYQAIKKYDI